MTYASGMAVHVYQAHTINRYMHRKHTVEEENWLIFRCSNITHII